MKHETFRIAETDPDQAFADAVYAEIGDMLRSALKGAALGLVVVLLIVWGAL